MHTFYPGDRVRVNSPTSVYTGFEFTIVASAPNLGDGQMGHSDGRIWYLASNLVLIAEHEHDFTSPDRSWGVDETATCRHCGIPVMDGSLIDLENL